MAVKKSNTSEPEETKIEISTETPEELKNATNKAAETATDERKQAARVSNTIKAKNEPQAAKNAPKQYVYIGPSVPRGKLLKNAIFAGSREEIEKYLADVLEKYPKVKTLIVPIEELAISREQVSKTGNAINRYYVELASEFKA